MNPSPSPETTPRIGGVVWGLLIVVLGALALATGLGWRIDLQLTAIVVLAVAGLGLLVRALSSGRE